MKFTLSWLKDYLETDAALDVIGETLTQIGLEVEEISNPADALRDFVIVDVMSAEPHPDADKLRVCQVTDGTTTSQIVCGAHNARAGMKAVLGRPGTYVPGADLTLKVSKIRGVESHGMMCSARELELGDDHDGILDLPADAEAGQSYADYAGLDDPVIEIAITPNRQDCLGVYGIARDLAAAGLGTLKPLTVPEIDRSAAAPIVPAIDPAALDSGACPAFYGRYFAGVTNGPSPEWLQSRLKAVGQQPISALVDITNYISIAFARPLHVYDADTLRGNPTARAAKAGERFVALDGKTYSAAGGETVIADDASLLGFGGIIGGEVSGCTEATKNVLLECALFDPILTAKTGRRHQIDTDARYRFERGVDANFVEAGLALASQMILDLCGGTPSEALRAGTAQWDAPVLAFRPERVAELGGFDVPAGECRSILESLGFGVAGDGPFDVTVPSWRVDVEGEADLVEEVLRIKGYDHVQSAALPPRDRGFEPTLPLALRRSRTARRALAARGMNECVTWSMVTEDTAAQFGGGGADLVVANPISNLLAVMRPTPFPNLLEAAKRNQDRGAAALALFEVGPAYENDTPKGQRLVATGVRAGAAVDRHWADTARDADVFDAKADALAALAAVGAPVENLQTFGEAGSVFHPGRSGTLRLGPKTILARFGEFHPNTLKAFDLDGRAVGFEVYLDAVPARKRSASRGALDVTNLQVVSRDFAFVMPRASEVQPLLRAVKGADKTHVSQVTVFDVYQGTGVAEDEKSVGICVTLEPTQTTFSEDDLDALSAKIIAAAQKAVGARLR